MSKHAYTPYREIASELNIREGDVLLLTSDILRLAMKARKAEKAFSVDAFLDSFMDVLGEKGTLLIPAYNFDLEDGDEFNIRKTMPMTGSLAVAAMRRSDFIRTAHPLHSFLVWGKDAEKLAAMTNKSSFGSDSPFAWLMEKNALLLFVGTTLAEALTFTHFVEESEKVGYRRYHYTNISYSDRDGQTSNASFQLYAKKPGWTMQLHRLQELIPKQFIQQESYNDIFITAIRAKDAYEIISKDIKHNKAASIAAFTYSLYFRDIIKQGLRRFKLFRTTHGKIRSAKRTH
jgi:aminoglycoside 3-N-acetyltransferase